MLSGYALITYDGIDDSKFSLPQLVMEHMEEFTGDEVTQRTVRHYIREGLLSPALDRGPGRHYRPKHLVELSIIRIMKRLKYSMDEIKEYLYSDHCGLLEKKETMEAIYLKHQRNVPEHYKKVHDGDVLSVKEVKTRSYHGTSVFS